MKTDWAVGTRFACNGHEYEIVGNGHDEWGDYAVILDNSGVSRQSFQRLTATLGVGTITLLEAAAEKEEEEKKEEQDSMIAQGGLLKSVDDLNLSVRADNRLRDAGIKTLGELVLKTEHDLVKLPGFGRTSLEEVKRKLAAYELKLAPEKGA